MALERQREQKVPLGLILSTIGIVGRYQLYRALARIWGLPFVDLLKQPPDPAVATVFSPRLMLEAGFIPLHKTGSHATIAITQQPDAALRETIRRTLGVGRLQYAVTTPWDIREALNRVFGEDLVALPGRNPRSRRTRS